jgi:hypothetical protein
MIEFNRRRHEQEATLAALPGLAAEIDLGGCEPLRGTLVHVTDDRVVIDVASATQAAAIAAVASARLIVHAPGVSFEATAAPSGSAQGHAVALVVDAESRIERRSA